MTHFILSMALLAGGCAVSQGADTAQEEHLLPPRHVMAEATGIGPSRYLATERALHLAAARAFGVDVWWRGDWDGCHWREVAQMSTHGKLVSYSVLSSNLQPGGWRIRLRAWFREESAPEKNIKNNSQKYRSWID